MKARPAILLCAAALLAAAAPMLAEPPYSGLPVTSPAEEAELFDEFQGNLRENGLGRLLRCSVMTRVRHQSRNRIFGAICSVQTAGPTRDFLICTDDGIGHFALGVPTTHDRESVTEFGFHNCGGWIDPGDPDPGNMVDGDRIPAIEARPS